jgi:alpha-L-fucosidase
VFDWPHDGRLEVPGLKNQALRAYLLADRAQELQLAQTEDVLCVTLPVHRPVDEVDTVVVLEISGTPEVDPPVVEQGREGTMDLDYVHAITAGRAIKRFNRKGRFYISKWTSPEDTVTWHLDVTSPGTFLVSVTYSAREEWLGKAWTVSVGSQRLTAQVEHTGDWYEYKTFEIGTIDLPEPGRYTIQICPASPTVGDMMYLQSAQLARVGQSGR